MRYTILMGSPRKNGNTASLLKPFIEELEKSGGEVDYIRLYDIVLKPCIGCGTCQDVLDGFGCPLVDDMGEIFDTVNQTDCLILATPIYSWYCTPPMKSTLDRLVYGINKYYGEKPGSPLWQGKKLALITTCGYPPAHGSDLFEEGIKRYCKHSKMDYIGAISVRDTGYKSTFINEEKNKLIKDFAQQIIKSL